MNPEVRPDLARRVRTGLDEAVLAGPKTVDQLIGILEEADRPLLLTRLRVEQLEALPDQLRETLDYDERSQTAFSGEPSPPSGAVKVAVVCAGTSDRSVAAEAERSLEFSGVPHLSVSDVGVAGLWRLLEHVESLAELEVVIAVAGMDAALPTVLAGLVPGLVIAVPTSVGYGVAERGTAALHSALASCAPGLVTVNVDNGYGAACAAIRSLRSLSPAGD